MHRWLSLAVSPLLKSGNNGGKANLAAMVSGLAEAKNPASRILLASRLNVPKTG